MNIYGYYYDNGSFWFHFSFVHRRERIFDLCKFMFPQRSRLWSLELIKRCLNRKSCAIKTALKSLLLGSNYFLMIFFPHLNENTQNKMKKKKGKKLSQTKIIINLLVCHLWPEFVIESLGFLGVFFFVS